MDINRILSLSGLNESVFLFGCRQVGKTWLLERQLDPDIYIDLLKQSELVRYTRNMELLGAEIDALDKKNALVVIDEIQKLPGLLDEVHRAIESSAAPRFVLTGSSARKLKRAHANMLGGRALTMKLFPFCYPEVRDLFALTPFLHFGGLPKVFLATSDRVRQQLLESYVQTYLRQGIYEEATIRNPPAFTTCDTWLSCRGKS